MSVSINIIGKNSFVGNYFLEKYKNEKTEEICLVTNKLENISFINTEIVIHLAALVHQMKGAPEKNYFEVNSDLAFETAKKAKNDGVLHFVFMSTVKVYGEFTEPDKPWTEYSHCNPLDPYGKSKLEGEQRIQELEDENFTVSIVRTPLVYGPGVRANMFNLLKMVNKYPFVTFGNIYNKRSLSFVGNLCQLIYTIIKQKKPGIFLATDESPVSTTYLVKTISQALGKKNNIISISGMAQKIVKIIKPDIHRRLFGNLEVDNTKTCQILNYKPEYSFEQGIKEMVDWYKSQK